MRTVLYGGITHNHSVPVIVSEKGLVYIGSFNESLQEAKLFVDSKGLFTFQEKSPLLTRALEELDEYLDGIRNEFSTAIDFQWGTPFQQLVWSELLKVPFGNSSNYSEIAIAIGRPKAVRAVGTAIGNNPISIIVPCHRILTKSGHLGGYSGGLSMKETLLKTENISYKA